jgi:hypothetical protein
MKKSELQQLIKEEIQSVLNKENYTSSNPKFINEGFEDLLQQLSSMAEKGEIGNEEIKSIQNTLMSARRKGQQNIRQTQPGYEDKKKSSTEQGKQTRMSFKEVQQLKKQIEQKFDISPKEAYALIFTSNINDLKPDIKTKVEKAIEYWNSNILPDLEQKYPLVNPSSLQFYS